jgi:hypothetical protein
MRLSEIIRDLVRTFGVRPFLIGLAVLGLGIGVGCLDHWDVFVPKSKPATRTAPKPAPKTSPAAMPTKKVSPALKGAAPQ